MSRSPTRIALLVLIALVTASCSELRNLPTLTEDDLGFSLAQSSKIYAADGSLITSLHETQNRTIVPLDQIPVHFQRAVIAIEDERFYKHDGVDLRAIVRAVVANVASGSVEEGGSTITQQYVKNVIISPDETAEQSLRRKIVEAALSRQLEKRLSKKEILRRYLNTVYFGKGAYGVQEAAQTFFGKPAKELKVAESALLAGLIQAPEYYDPFDRPKAARNRRDTVLRKMTELGWVEESKLPRLLDRKLHLRSEASTLLYQAPYFVDYVTRLIKWDPRFRFLGSTVTQREKKLFQGGLRIHTTVDLSMQRAAEQAVASVLPYKSDPHASMVAIDPQTGYVKAMVGGRNWFATRKQDRYAKLNLAIQAEPGLGCVRAEGKRRCVERRAAGTGRQGGSAFKPFALAAAIDEGISLAKSYKAGRCMDIPGADAGRNWHVCNYEESAFGEISLLEATISSVNVVYAQLILDVGEQDVVDTADAMGINTELTAVPSAVLGANAVNPMGMASAYGTLATNGVHHPPVAITKIFDPSQNRAIYTDDSEPEEVLKPAVAYLTTTALERVMQEGTGTGAQIGRPAAGKTGTAQEYRDAWFVGYTPDLVASVWIGYPQGEIEMKASCFGSGPPCIPTRIQVTGGSWPASIWQAFMLRALAGIPGNPFQKPAVNLVTVTIDKRGDDCLASTFTPQEFRETIQVLRGTEPTETCRIKGGRKIPDVFGFPADDAEEVLEDAGFNVDRTTQETNKYPPGRVVGQDPGAGERAPEGSTVTIVVSVKKSGDERTVPDVLGQTEASARAEIRDAGFKVRVIHEKESGSGANQRRGRVWKQQPSSGTEAERGSTVTIWVNPQ